MLAKQNTSYSINQIKKKSFSYIQLSKLNGIEIKREQSLKFLGVIIDENLNWKNHIDLLVNTISKNVGIIYKASKVLKFNCLKNIYIFTNSLIY